MSTTIRPAGPATATFETTVYYAVLPWKERHAWYIQDRATGLSADGREYDSQGQACYVAARLTAERRAARMAQDDGVVPVEY